MGRGHSWGGCSSYGHKSHSWGRSYKKKSWFDRDEDCGSKNSYHKHSWKKWKHHDDDDNNCYVKPVVCKPIDHNWCGTPTPTVCEPVDPTPSVCGPVDPQPCDPTPCDPVGTCEDAIGTDLIVNGGFENNFLNNCGWGQRSEIEGWTATSGKIEIQEQNYETGNAQGNAVLELDASGNASVAQTVDVVYEGTYTFSLDYMMRGTDADTNGFAVYIDDVLQTEVFPTDQGTQTLTFDIDLDAGATKIELVGLGESDCIGTVIDDVSLLLIDCDPQDDDDDDDDDPVGPPLVM